MNKQANNPKSSTSITSNANGIPSKREGGKTMKTRTISVRTIQEGTPKPRTITIQTIQEPTPKPTKHKIVIRHPEVRELQLA